MLPQTSDRDLMGGYNLQWWDSLRFLTTTVGLSEYLTWHKTGDTLLNCWLTLGMEFFNYLLTRMLSQSRKGWLEFCGLITDFNIIFHPNNLMLGNSILTRSLEVEANVEMSSQLTGSHHKYSLNWRYNTISSMFLLVLVLSCASTLVVISSLRFWLNDPCYCLVKPPWQNLVFVSRNLNGNQK